MPLGKIELRTLSPEEKAVYDRLGTLKYPEHIDLIRHLSGEEFRVLLYAMNPQLALKLADERDFREVMEYQASKRWYHELRDYVWRKQHGSR